MLSLENDRQIQTNEKLKDAFNKDKLKTEYKTGISDMITSIILIVVMLAMLIGSWIFFVAEYKAGNGEIVIFPLVLVNAMCSIVISIAIKTNLTRIRKLVEIGNLI